jgi:hypothetical protein
MAVGLVIALDASLALAQVKMVPPSDQPTVRSDHVQLQTPPPTRPSPTTRSVSRMRFEPRADLRDTRVPTFRGGRLTSFDTVPVWPLWEGILPVVPMEAVQPSQTELRGGLQLDVQPWRAEVYVDGAYAGVVQDFGGYYRPLELIPGPHAITIVAPDFDPLMFDIVIVPGRTMTYRGTLSRASGR